MEYPPVIESSSGETSVVRPLSSLIKLGDVGALEAMLERQKKEHSRKEVLRKFVDRINALRVAGGYKPYPAGYIASRMYKCGMKTNYDLNIFYGFCADAQNFSSCWHWSIKNKLEKQKND